MISFVIRLYLFFNVDYVSNSVCGFNTGIVFEDIDDDDIQYVEEYTRTKIAALIETHLDKTDFFNKEQHGPCFFGKFTSNPTEFKYSLSDKWLIRQIIEHF